MTTESKPLLGAALASGVLVGVLAVVADQVVGSTAVRGSVVGGVLTLVVFLTGTVVVNTVAGLMPASSLLIAMLTYVLQVVVMALVVLALVRSGAGDEPAFREWFAGSVIAVTMLWLAVQVWLFTRLRIPVFDGADQARTGGER